RFPTVNSVGRMKTPRERRLRARVRSRRRGASAAGSGGKVGGGNRRGSSEAGSFSRLPSSVSRLTIRTSRLPPRDRGAAGLHLVSPRDQDFGVVRQEQVDAGSQPDHSNPLTAPQPFAYARIEHDTAGERSRDLLEGHGAALRSERDPVLLVLDGRLLAERRGEPARRILIVRDVARDRGAVHVTVEDGHEDRQAAGRPGRGLGSVGDGEHGAVGGGDDRVLSPLRNALRIAKERKQKE